MLTFQGCDRGVEGDRWDIKRLKDIKGKRNRRTFFLGKGGYIFMKKENVELILLAVKQHNGGFWDSKTLESENVIC
jgi:hypothetical protein